VEDTGLRVLVVGIDGATWEVFGPLMEAGELPGFSDLAGAGAVATLHSPPPQVSPAIWTTIVTGQPPRVHGVREYLLVSFPGLARFPFEALTRDLAVVPFFWVGLSYFLAGVAEGVPPTSEQVRVKTLWHMLADGGDKSLVLGWPCTWPAEDLPGLTVTDRFGPNEFDLFSRSGAVQGRVHPAHREAELAALRVDSGSSLPAMIRGLGLESELGQEDVAALERFRYNPMLPEPLQLLTDVYDADLTYLNILGSELKKGEHKLALVMLNGIDLAMHAFWKDRFPEAFGLSGAPHPRWGLFIDAFHRFADRQLAGILSGGAGDDTVVVVISDHGMEAAPANPIWPGWHAPEALLILSGGPVRPGLVLDDFAYRDVTPTVLYLLGYPVPADLPGKIRLDCLDPEFVGKHPPRSIASFESP
jgi:predicted AlkP superfamily phosphohydrolase/phosphomutase